MEQDMGGLTVILPVHNLYKRGHLRIFNSCYSLLKQKDLYEIIIVDSSIVSESRMLYDLLLNLKTDKIKYISAYNPVFNKSKLLNKGVKEAKTKWIMCTDADYIFKHDFLSNCELLRGEGKILFKEVKMLPRVTVKRILIDQWRFPISKYNEWGKLANGACQYTTKQFFIDNPYPEEMEGFGAMDNIMAYIAINKGLNIHWVKQSEILHQHHANIKYRTKDDLRRSNNNQKILAAYIKENNLPKILTKTR